MNRAPPAKRASAAARLPIGGRGADDLCDCRTGHSSPPLPAAADVDQEASSSTQRAVGVPDVERVRTEAARSAAGPGRDDVTRDPWRRGRIGPWGRRVCTLLPPGAGPCHPTGRNYPNFLSHRSRCMIGGLVVDGKPSKIRRHALPQERGRGSVAFWCRAAARRGLRLPRPDWEAG